MANISHRNSTEDTTTSMYFDAESTMSTACYKTLEEISDTSNLSVDITGSNGEDKGNRTLEANTSSINVSPLETVKKKFEFLDVKLNTTPLKAIPKNILSEYKAICSTPSKEQLLKTVDMTRGSDTTGCVDLGFAFLNIDDEKPAFFPPPSIGKHEENKENFFPDAEEGSTLSTCSVETVTSVIEKKICSMSTVGSISEADSINGIKIAENVDKFINPHDKVSENCTLPNDGGYVNRLGEIKYETTRINREGFGIMSNTNNEKCNEYLEINGKNFVSESLEVDESIKPETAALEGETRERQNVLHNLEVPTLPICSVASGTSDIEEKMRSMPTVRSTSEVKSTNDTNILENFNKISPRGKVSKNCSLVNHVGCENKPGEKKYDLTGINRGFKSMSKSNSEECSVRDFETKEKNSVGKRLEIKENNKPKTSALTRRTQFSVCEPNLQTGKPSRISSSNSIRRSLLPTSKKPTANVKAEVEIPLLINKMLKITDNNENTAQNTESKERDDQKLYSKSAIETRSSQLTSTAGYKRPFSFAQRMSVVVKTTLNSPARKIARRSAMSSVLQPIQRKSVLPQTITSVDSSKFQRAESSLRKSMVPKPTISKINTQQNLNTLTSLQDTSTKTANASSQRKTVYHLPKTLEKDQFSQKNPVILYTCNVCKEKFRIKSLLDAHKRSHESDNSPPAFVKKPSAAKEALSGLLHKIPNQCKYCDKKFALTKALHIHLLQNCPKIPPSEKRKLQYTDLNHVEKAQLPNVFLNNNPGSTASERLRYANNKNMITKSSSESLNDKKGKSTSDLKTNVNGNNLTSQTTPHITKKISAHAGVYRTPSKTVPCHLCKLTFKSILDYTNHNLASHGNNKTNAENDKSANIATTNLKASSEFP